MTRKQEIEHIVLTMVFGSMCCMVLGALFFGLRIFNKELPIFQIASFGLVGSVAFSFFYFKRHRDAAYVLTLLFIANIIVANLTKVSFLVIHFLYFSSLIVAMFLFSKYFFIQIANMKFSRPLVLASIIALLFVMATGLQWVIFANDGVPFYPLGNLPIGFLIGLGLGVGFELSDYLYSRKIVS